MPAPLAILLGFVGVLVLFYLDRDKSVRTSKALWIPIIWLALIGSRPPSAWFDTNNQVILASSADVDGSPVDAAPFAVLLVIGIGVLIARRKKVSRYLPSIVPLILYFAYCFISISWSPVPEPSLKRWIKDIGDVSMVLLIVTDPQPLIALRRIFSRVGFLLFPISVVLIRYTALGRAWDNDGMVSYVGVTTNKNMFGLILFVISLGVLWSFRWLLVNKDAPGRKRRLWAHGILLLCSLYLLNIAHSSTSLACFGLGSFLMLASHLRFIRRKPRRVHIFGAATFAFAASIVLLGGSAVVASVLGRDASFSGRTTIWSSLLPTATNPLFGTGFDSYWDSPNALQFQQTMRSLGWYHPEGLNEAHNGYLEVYLNLGWIGSALLALILITCYLSACKSFRRDREVGSLMFGYIVSCMIYGITEAGFRTLSPNWFFILLALVSTKGINAGLFGNSKIKQSIPRTLAARFAPVPQKALPRPIEIPASSVRSPVA